MVAQIDSQYIMSRPTRLWARAISFALFEGRPITTRGRWINPLVFGLFHVARVLPQMKRADAPIFILGSGRSGTTVLGILFSMHPRVGFLNEPKAMWHKAVGGGEDLVGSYDRGPARYRLAAVDATAETSKVMKRIHATYMRTTFTSRVVDKYPELIFRLPFIRAIFPDAKFIFIARRGWDTCNSINDWSARLGKQQYGETHDWWGVNGRKWQLLVSQLVPEHPDLEPHAAEMMGWTSQDQRAAVEWIVTTREGLSHANSFPETVLHVPYEKLCSSPRGWMSRIAAFTDLPEDETFLSYAEKKLKPISPKSPFKLEPCLEAPFADTMRRAGYDHKPYMAEWTRG